MTQEQNELILKDLCARLPYGVIIDAGPQIRVLNGEDFDFYSKCTNPVCTPYLRPISSMSEAECNKLFEILEIDEESGKEWIKINDVGIIRLFTEVGKDFYEIAEAMDYLYSIHVDFRNLIEKGLALEAPEGMYEG